MRKFCGFTLALAVVTALALAPISADDKKSDAPKQKLKTDIEVPYVPTHQKVVEAMLKLAAVKEGDRVYDLGCGDGRIVITAVGKFKAKNGLGIDFDPARLKDCQASVKKAITEKTLTEDQAKTLTFKQGDVLKLTAADFKNADVVTLYLLPSVNLRLKPILLAGLKEGARVVSHDFDMGDWVPDKKEEVQADRTHTIYLWTIKKKK